jgi:uncharacterized membrane protein
MSLSLALRSTAAAAALWMAAVPAPAAAQGVTVVNIGPGAVTDISADGRAATGQANVTSETFRWTPETGIVKLGRGTYRALQGRVSGTPGISDDGQTIASTILDDTRDHGTQGLWTVAGGWQQLTPPLPADGGILDAEDSSVFGLSRDGKVVTGLYWRPGQSGGSAHGSVWSAATNMKGLPTAGGSARIDDANADGSVLAGWEEDPVNGSRRPAIWAAGSRSILGSSGEVASINAVGNIAAGQIYNEAAGRSEAARWVLQDGSWSLRTLGVLPGTKPGGFSYATALSDDGRIVVGFNRKNFNVFETDAFIWTEQTGMVDFNAFLKSRGVDLSDKTKVNFLPAITGNGRVIAAVATDVAPPYTTRSLLIKLSR